MWSYYTNIIIKSLYVLMYYVDTHSQWGVLVAATDVSICKGSNNTYYMYVYAFVKCTCSVVQDQNIMNIE